MKRELGTLRPAWLALLCGIVPIAATHGGVASVAKRVLLSDPALIDRVENIIEWWFALALSVAFIALAELMHQSGYRLEAKIGAPE